MEVLIVVVLAFAALLKFRMARAIARSPMGPTKRGQWMARTQQMLGVFFLLVAIGYIVWRRSAS